MTSPPDPQAQPPRYDPPPGYGGPRHPPTYGQQPPPGYGPVPAYGPPPGYGQQPGYGPPPGGYGSPPPAGPGAPWGPQPGWVGQPPPGHGPAQGGGPGWGTQQRGPGGGVDLSPAGLRAAYSGAQPPPPVHGSFRMVASAAVLAVAVQVVAVIGFLTLVPSNSIVSVGGQIAKLVVVLLFAAAAVVLATLMRAGLAWARIATAVVAVIGALYGLFSFVGSFDVFRVADLVTGFSQVFGGAGAVDVGLLYAFGTLQLVSGIAELALLGYALHLMFRPQMNGYFR